MPATPPVRIYPTPEEMDEEDEGERDDVVSDISIIPVIGVCLVLLVVIMVTAPIINIPNVPVDLPSAWTQETKERNITVSCSADGTIAVKTRVVTIEEFPARFARELARADNPLVIIRADKELPYGEVENIVRIIKKAGAQRIAFGTEQKTPEN